MGNSIKYNIIKKEHINQKKICCVCKKIINGNHIVCLECRNLLDNKPYFYFLLHI